jgi:hypothetical protein
MPSRGDFKGGNSCSNQVSHSKNKEAGEYTVCSEEKYELPRGFINAVNANKWQITKHYPKEIPWLTSYFSEEYTAYYPGTTQHKKCETVINNNLNERNLNICTIR